MKHHERKSINARATRKKLDQPRQTCSTHQHPNSQSSEFDETFQTATE